MIKNIKKIFYIFLIGRCGGREKTFHDISSLIVNDLRNDAKKIILELKSHGKENKTTKVFFKKRNENISVFEEIKKVRFRWNIDNGLFGYGVKIIYHERYIIILMKKL